MFTDYFGLSQPNCDQNVAWAVTGIVLLGFGSWVSAVEYYIRWYTLRITLTKSSANGRIRE